MGLRQVFLRVLQLSPSRIIPTVLHIRLHLYVALTGRINGQNILETGGQRDTKDFYIVGVFAKL